MSMYAWRTATGETKKGFEYREKRKEMNWYESADDPSKWVLLYSVEKTEKYENTGIKHKDRYLNTIASDGSKCSGKVTKWVSVAREGTYTNDGVMK